MSRYPKSLRLPASSWKSLWVVTRIGWDKDPGSHMGKVSRFHLVKQIQICCQCWACGYSQKSQTTLRPAPVNLGPIDPWDLFNNYLGQCRFPATKIFSQGAWAEACRLQSKVPPAESIEWVWLLGNLSVGWGRFSGSHGVDQANLTKPMQIRNWVHGRRVQHR